MYDYTNKPTTESPFAQTRKNQNNFLNQLPRATEQKPTPYPLVSNGYKKQENRYGMTSNVWEKTLTATETLLDIIKAIMVVGGILAANLADVIFGAVGITILFGGSSALFNGTPVWVIGLILSMGASAIQIFLWSMIQKRGITISHLIHWKKLPTDVQTFLAMAFTVWALDTLIDMSPIALLVQNSQYESITPLYIVMVASVSILVFILCGFSEIMTSNMRAMLTGGEIRK